jgi:hypothetical protein
VGWMREARVGAAREFGARHHRGFMAFEAAGGAGRVLLWVLPPVAVLAAVVWAVWHLQGVGRWVALAVLAVVALTTAARFRLLVPLFGLAVVAGVVWLAWYAVSSSAWWPVGVVVGVLLVGLLARGRLGYWRAMMR